MKPLQIPSNMVRELSAAECRAEADRCRADLERCADPKTRRFLEGEVIGWHALAVERDR